MILLLLLRQRRKYYGRRRKRTPYLDSGTPSEELFGRLQRRLYHVHLQFRRHPHEQDGKRRKTQLYPQRDSDPERGLDRFERAASAGIHIRRLGKSRRFQVQKQQYERVRSRRFQNLLLRQKS